METMNEKWNLIFNSEINEGEHILKVIVKRILTALANGEIRVPALMPTQRLIIEDTQLSKYIVEDVYRELKNLNILKTKSGGGSHLVKKYPNGRGAAKKKKEEKQTSIPLREVLLGEELVLQTTNSISSFIGQWNRLRKNNDMLNSEQRKMKIRDEVLENVTKLLSGSLANDYKKDQVYYASGYQWLLYILFTALLTDRKEIIMLGPVSKLVWDTIDGITLKHKQLLSDNKENFVEKLNIHCSNGGRVGIVYLSSRRLGPFYDESARENLAKLHALQDSYNFIIVEDDRDVSLFRTSPNLLMSMVSDKREQVVYLRPFSSFLPLNEELNLICGPSKLIKNIRDKFQLSGKGITAGTSLTLESILNLDLLVKSEKAVLKKATEMMKVARKVFKDAGIWTSESIMAGNVWFLRLKLIRGMLPDNIYGLLLKEHISIINPADYVGFSPLQNEVCISLAACVCTSDLVNDLTKFNEAINILILKPENYEY